MTWVSLHCHSQYSILDSTASIHDISKKASEFGMSALALTDFCNMFGAIDFIKNCKEVEVKPIIGCEIMVAPNSRHEKKKVSGCHVGYPLILLAKDQKGYCNLCKISSIGYREGFYYTPRVDKEVLERYAKGLVCLSGPIQSRLSQAIIHDQKGEWEREVAWSQQTYGEDFYFELQRHHMNEEHIVQEGINKESWLLQRYLDRVRSQEKVISCLIELSKSCGIPVVATNDIHYIHREDWKAHEILMNIQSGEPCELVTYDSSGTVLRRIDNPKRRVVPTHELYFKSPEEMCDLFSDIPEAIATSECIAKMCTLEINFKQKFYPVFIPPQLEGRDIEEGMRLKEVALYLRDLCTQGLEKRYTQEHLEKVQEKYPDQDPMDVVRGRLENELDIITSKGMCDYLLIVYDFIAWAKERGIPVGPGRGSGVGSIILYLIGITDIEPLRFNLFFERFINPERISYPDIDVDICMERRSEVIDYAMNKYGRDRVAQIITFGTMKAKMAIRDVGRVLNIPLSRVNSIAKLVPEDPTMTLQRAFDIDPELRKIRDQDEEGSRILEYAQRLEGSIRNTGIHAAGLIICGEALTNHIPVCSSKDSDMIVTQYSMKPVEAVGMLKIDFLGLKTLTSIQKSVDAIEDKEIKWTNLPLDDRATFNLLNQGKTQGVFQLESSGMQELAKNLHIDKFEEIIAMGALYRPGPMEMIPSFINRKQGKEKIEVSHPLMEEIIRETYGIIVYQEQVMQIASRLANYTLGEGDVLRRAMGKKDKKEMAKQRKKFCGGALENGIDKERATEIFDKIEKFASYGFNKSHATAYGYLSYVTAYLKANYPKQWLAALMTCDIDDLSKVAKHIHECHALHIQVLPPDINEAGKEFVSVPSGIRFAMLGIKGVGRGAVEAILEERSGNGPFQSFHTFLRRIDTNKVGKRVVENLIGAGSFDFTGHSRQRLLSGLVPMFERRSREQKERARGILDMFSAVDEEVDIFVELPEVDCDSSRIATLAKERELVGFYLTGHPMDEYRDMIVRLGCLPLQDIKILDSGVVVRAAFIVEGVKIKTSQKSQKKFAILEISDGAERFELPIWSNMYEEKHELLIENALLYAILQIGRSEDNLKLKCHALEGLTHIGNTEIEALHASFEEVKRSVMDESKYRGREKRGKNGKQVKEQGTLHITLDADCVTLSEIVKLRKLFHKFPGPSSLVINFLSEAERVGTIFVESKEGIGWGCVLKENMEGFSFIQSFSFEG